MSKPLPEQFTLDREDKIRKDLEGRITALDQKIELKVSNHVLYWVTPIVMISVAGVFGFAFNLISKSGDKIDLINDRLARIETKVDDMNKPQNQKH